MSHFAIGPDEDHTKAIRLQFIDFMNYLGLKYSTVQVESTSEDKLLTTVTFSIPSHPMYSDNAIMDNFITSQRDSIRNSEEFKRMVLDVRQSNSDLITQVVKLQQELKDLEVLKNHYDVEMRLRHGEPVLSIDGSRK